MPIITLNVNPLYVITIDIDSIMNDLLAGWWWLSNHVICVKLEEVEMKVIVVQRSQAC